MPLNNLKANWIAEILIRPIDSAEVEARVTQFAEIIVDAVAHGASVNFMAGFTNEEGKAFWCSQLPGIASNEKRLLIADYSGRLLGTVMLTFAQQPNAPHRAEITKMLVHSSARRQGLGRRLLLMAEEAAREAGRTLLLLDTETGSAGESLYRSLGWLEVGCIPDHSLRPDGRLADTTLFYKRL